MTTPPLLQKMLETAIGDIVVRRDCIIEPKTGCRIAYGFPNHEAAVTAAKEMNEVADWFGVVKARAAGGLPNCMDELEQIATAYGGRLARGAGPPTEKHCARVVSQYEGHGRKG